jgi:hypothetical protein
MLGCVNMKMTIIKWDESMLTRCFERFGDANIQKSKVANVKSSQKAVYKEPEPELDLDLDVKVEKKEYETTVSQPQETTTEPKAYSSEEKIVFKAFMNDSAQKLNNEQTKVKSNMKTDVKTKAIKWNDFEHAINIAMGKADENFDD